jgi:hypothetical protein
MKASNKFRMTARNPIKEANKRANPVNFLLSIISSIPNNKNIKGVMYMKKSGKGTNLLSKINRSI